MSKSKRGRLIQQTCFFVSLKPLFSAIKLDPASRLGSWCRSKPIHKFQMKAAAQPPVGKEGNASFEHLALQIGKANCIAKIPGPAMAWQERTTLATYYVRCRIAQCAAIVLHFTRPSSLKEVMRLPLVLQGYLCAQQAMLQR